MSQEILKISHEISNIATHKIHEIQAVTASSRVLALNAKIEAARAGEAGLGFGIVADEVKRISLTITEIADDLKRQMQSRSDALQKSWNSTFSEVRGARLADLALNMIDIIDRNLYERSCDVRWWATDSAVVECLETPTDAAARFATKRLGVILGSYTVYLDLWVVDGAGRVVASGRPDIYPGVIGANVASESWYQRALATRDGTEFAVADICANPLLHSRPVATYATAIRRGGEINGDRLGVLGIFFDWEPQAQAVVDSVRLEAEERRRTRALLLDSRGRIIAASDGAGVLQETLALAHKGRKSGSYIDGTGRQIGFALTPGYETYRGMGWYGVLVQSPETASSA